MLYQIELNEYDCEDRLTSSCVLPFTFTDFRDANCKILSLSELQRTSNTHLIHRVGQSVVCFPTKRVEFTRTSTPIEDY